MLYNKYRPKRFGGVIGQPAAVGLRKFVAVGKLPSAILLSGPRGCGKTTIARILCLAVDCQDPRDGEPCLECKSCKYGYHLEKDAGQYRNEADVRELIDYLRSRPAFNRTRAVIDEAHALTKRAQIAFLKMVEEPPKDSLVILITTEPGKLDDALKSRCSWWPIHMVGQDDLVAHLRKISKQEGIKLSKDAAVLIAHNSRGSVRDCLSLLEALSGYERPVTEKLVRWAQSIVDVEGLVTHIAEKDIPGIFRESERLYTLYPVPSILVEAAKALMEKSRGRYEDNKSEAGRHFARIAAHLYANRSYQVVSELAHLQVTLVEAADLSYQKLIHKDVNSGLWQDFLDSIEIGIETGFYPYELASDVLLLDAVQVHEERGVVAYAHILDQEMPERIVAAFNEYADDEYEWRKDDNLKSRRPAGEAPRTKRHRKRSVGSGGVRRRPGTTR